MKHCFIFLTLLILQISVSEGAISSEKVESNDLSLHEKIGQLMMIGFEGTVPTEGLKEQIESMNIGGVIIYPRNIENPKQVQILTKSISVLNKSPLPILIATDEEGGRVIRFYNDDVTMPGNLAIGVAGSKEIALEIGKSIGARLYKLGININLAPVLDLNIESDNRIVGSRSFGEDPDMVSTLGRYYLRGVQSLGVSATAKHFPGHGRTKIDSHKSLPIIKSDLEKDLIPFQDAIDEKVDLIMTAHVAYSKLDSSGLPATLSKKIITKLLREKMNYKGVVITDDLEMGAIENQFGIGEAAVRAIVAGCDIVIVGWSVRKQKKVFKALLEAVKKGRISKKRLDEALNNIKALKNKYSDKIKRNEFEIEANKIVSNGMQIRLARKITNESATLIKNDGKILPLDTNKKRTLVISPLYELYREMRKRAENIFYVGLEIRPTEDEKKRTVKYIKEISDKVDQIVVGVINRHHAEIVERIKKETNKPIIVVSFDSPHYISKFPEVEAFLCVYHYRTSAAEAAARVILGDLKARVEDSSGTPPLVVSKNME